MQRTFAIIALATSVSAFTGLTHAEPITADKKTAYEHCDHKAGKMDGLDGNKDGSISKTEFDAFHNLHFTEMDKNKDGNISKEEMQAIHEDMHKKHGKMMGDKYHGMKMPTTDQPTTPSTTTTSTTTSGEK